MSCRAVYRCLCLLVLVGCLAMAGRTPAQEKKEGDWIILFNGTDLAGWQKVASKPEPADTWLVKDGVIACTGKPFGYLHTDKTFKNYVLVFDHQLAPEQKPKDDKKVFNANSGVLIHIQPPHKVWPKCVEVQGMHWDYGMLRFHDCERIDAYYNQPLKKKVIKGITEWNTTEVTCKEDGSITVKVNGMEMSRGKSDLTEGLIGLQSEGYPANFKNIKVKEMK